MQLAAVLVGGDTSCWERLGFAVGGGRIALGNAAIEFVDAPPGVHGLAVSGAPVPPDVDGVRIVSGVPAAADEHPNGAFELDHVVITSDSLERTSAAVAGLLGLPQRRIRETPSVRQAFHRFDAPAGGGQGCIVEIVDSPKTTAGVALFGLVVNVADLEELCRHIGPELVGQPKSAVQPGRTIATVRSAAGLGVPVALMSP